MAPSFFRFSEGFAMILCLFAGLFGLVCGWASVRGLDTHV